MLSGRQHLLYDAFLLLILKKLEKLNIFTHIASVFLRGMFREFFEIYICDQIDNNARFSTGIHYANTMLLKSKD